VPLALEVAEAEVSLRLVLRFRLCARRTQSPEVEVAV
jgi:hypothetical protein